MMAREKDREHDDWLRQEDRVLWDRVRSTAIPLREEECLNVDKKVIPALFSMQRANVDKRQNGADDSLKGANRKQSPLQLSPFDRSTYRKISKGRLEIEGRVDLHGLYRDAAYSLLFNFLKSAQHNGLRHVLVITGKGLSLGSEGVLRQVVPHWLETSPFRQIVSSFDDAPRNHGGKGALYVRIRRPLKAR